MKECFIRNGLLSVFAPNHQCREILKTICAFRPEELISSGHKCDFMMLLLLLLIGGLYWLFTIQVVVTTYRAMAA